MIPVIIAAGYSYCFSGGIFDGDIEGNQPAPSFLIRQLAAFGFSRSPRPSERVVIFAGIRFIPYIGEIFIVVRLRAAVYDILPCVVLYRRHGVQIFTARKIF